MVVQIKLVVAVVVVVVVVVMFEYGVFGPKKLTRQPNWYDIFVQWDSRPKLSPSLTGMMCLLLGFGPKLWTLQPNWHDMFAYGDSRQKL